MIFKKILLISFILFMSACSIKNTNDMVINSDGSMNYEIVIAFDRELISNLINMNGNVVGEISNISEKEMMEYVSSNIVDDYYDGFTKEEYINEEYIGYKYLYQVNNIDDISSIEKNIINIFDTESNDKFINKKLFSKDKNVYSAFFVYNLNDFEYTEVNYEGYFSVVLPRRAINHNADNVSDDGKTLVWNITNGKENSIIFSFKLQDYRAYMSLIFITAIVFSCILIYKIIIMIKGDKR